MNCHHVIDAIRPLPLNKRAIDVFADFLRYLFECARTYIQQTHPNGTQFWSSIETDIEFVLTHPNGWEGAQQNLMRRAAVLAGLVSDDVVGQSRVHFVTEGEASLHFCVQNGLSSHVLDVRVMPFRSSVLISERCSEQRRYHCGCRRWNNRFERIFSKVIDCRNFFRRMCCTSMSVTQLSLCDRNLTQKFNRSFHGVNLCYQGSAGIYRRYVGHDPFLL